MQYDIHINQLLMHTRYPDLNFQDGAILFFMRQFIGEETIEKHEENNKIWYWFAAQKIIDELPMLQITSKSTLNRRMNKIIELKIVERKIDCNKTYYSFSEDFFKLFRGESEVAQKRSTMQSENALLGEAKMHDNQNTNINIPKSNTYIKECFERFWKSYPLQDQKYKVRALKTFEYKSLHSRLPEILKAIEHYKQTKTVQQGFIFNPHRFLEEDIYKSYINGTSDFERKDDFKSKKFRDGAENFVQKLQRMERVYELLPREKQKEIETTFGQSIVLDGKQLFTKEESEVIRRVGGFENIILSYSATSVQDQIERILSEL